MSRFIANQRMRQKGQTKNRPEEKLVHEILETHARFIKLEEQKNIKYIDEQDRERDSFVDIYLKDNYGEVIVRIMGKYHDEETQRMKDELQEEYLKRDLYKVVDVWYYDNPTIFLRNKRKLTEKELVLAYNELKESLAGVIYLPPNPHTAWLKNTPHRK